MYIIVTTLPLQCLHFSMCYDSSYMEAFFILILPLFFLSRCVSTKPLLHSFLSDTTEDKHGGSKNNLIEQVRFDQKMTSYEMTKLKQKLLAIKDLEKYFQPVFKSTEVEKDTEDREMTLDKEQNGYSVDENNSSNVEQSYGVEVNHTDFNFSHFYWKKKKKFNSSSPRVLSLNSQNFNLTSLGKHNVPFNDTILQTVTQWSRDRTISPRRTEKPNKKTYHVAEGKRKRSINNDFDLVPPSPLQTHGTHSKSGKSFSTTDERREKAESTRHILLRLRIVSQTAGKKSRLESGKLSSSDKPLRSEGEQLEKRSRMFGVEEHDKKQSMNQANVRYEENMTVDRSEESRQKIIGLDQAVNMTAVQTEDEFTEKNWNKSSNEKIDIYDHVNMMQEDEGDASDGATDGLPWRQDESFSRASNSRFYNDVSVNSLKTTDEDNGNDNSYLRYKLRVGFPSHSDQQSIGNAKFIRTYINQSNLFKFLESKRLLGELEKKYRKLGKSSSQVNKPRDKSFSYVSPGFEFGTDLLPSGNNLKIVNEQLGHRKLLDTISYLLDKFTDRESKIKPSYSIETVNLPKENETDSNKILDKQSTPPNLKFDYIPVEARQSIENNLIRPESSPVRENFRVSRYLSKTRKTHTQHLLRKRRDLNGENNTLSLDTTTSLVTTWDESSTSFAQVTTITSFIEQSEEAVTMETELINVTNQDEITKDTNSSKKTFTTKEKNSVHQGHVRDAFDSINLVVSIQSDSSILYIMPSLVLITLLALAAEGVRRWRTIQKAQARVQLLPPPRGIDGDFTIENPLAFDPDVPSTSKSQPGSSSEDSGSPGVGKGPFTISHTNEFPIFNTFPHRSRRMTQDRSSSFDSSRQCCCTWCLIKSNDVQTTRL